MRVLTTDNSVQQATLGRIEPIIVARIGLLRDIIELLSAGDALSGSRIVAMRLASQALTEQISALATDLKAEEWRLLAERRATARYGMHLWLEISLGCGILAAASWFFAIALLMDRVRARQHFLELRRLNAGLEDKVRARNAEIAKSEDRFRLIVEAVPNAIVAFDADGIIELVNVEAEQIFRYPRGELQGRGIEILLAERLRADHRGLRKAFFAARQSRPVGTGRELHGCRRDGQEFPIEIGMSPMDTVDGIKALVSIVDITARRQAERTQAYCAAIVASSVDAIIAKDLDGVVTGWNKSSELMFGWSASEMIGERIIRLIPADRLDEEAAILAQIRQGERIDHFETERRRKDGAEFPVSLTISPIRGPGGDIIGASKIVRDITERTRMGENLRTSEDRFRSIFSAVGGGIFIVSPSTGAFTEINEVGCAMFGYAADELIGRDLRTLSSGIAPYTQREAAERIERAATSDHPQRFA